MFIRHSYCGIAWRVALLGSSCIAFRTIPPFTPIRYCIHQDFPAFTISLFSLTLIHRGGLFQGKIPASQVPFMCLL